MIEWFGDFLHMVVLCGIWYWIGRMDGKDKKP